MFFGTMALFGLASVCLGILYMLVPAAYYYHFEALASKPPPRIIACSGFVIVGFFWLAAVWNYALLKRIHPLFQYILMGGMILVFVLDCFRSKESLASGVLVVLAMLGLFLFQRSAIHWR